MKLTNITTLIFMFLVSSQAFAKNDVLEFYNAIIKKSSCEKPNFQENLVKLDTKIKEAVKEVAKKKKIESLYREQNPESDIFSYLGTEFLSDNSDLRGLKSCGKHYVKFIKLYESKSFDESDEQFGEWQSCLNSDYKEDIPDVAAKIINCYNSRSPNNVKETAAKKPAKK